MRFGPRKRAVAAAAVLGAVVLTVLVAARSLAVDAALVLVATGTVLVAVAFADVRSSRRARRLHDEVQQQTSALRQDLDERLAGLEGSSIDQLLARQEAAVIAATREQQTVLRRLSEDAVRTVTARLAHLDESLAGSGAATDRVLRRIDGLRTELRRSADHDVRAAEAAVGLQVALGDHPLPPTGRWAASSDLLSFLYRYVLVNRPGLVVECGSGVSTLVIASAMARIGHGRIVSYDHEDRYTERTRRWLAARGLADRAEVVHAALVPTEVEGETIPWYAIEPGDLPGEIDLLVVDGPPGVVGPQARYPAVPQLRDQLAAQAVVVLDDAGRDDEAAIFARWADLLADHDAEIIQHRKGTGVLYPPARRSTTLDVD